jgi:hypothetical protein
MLVKPLAAGGFLAVKSWSVPGSLADLLVVYLGGIDRSFAVGAGFRRDAGGQRQGGEQDKL